MYPIKLFHLTSAKSGDGYYNLSSYGECVYLYISLVHTFYKLNTADLVYVCLFICMCVTYVLSISRQVLC